MSGILAYGSWFYTAQSLQLVANNAARAAIAGLSVAERRTIALTSATSALRDASLDPAKGTITVTENAQMVQVSVQYDVSAEPMLQLPFVPLPGKIISTRASVMVGGLT